MGKLQKIKMQVSIASADWSYQPGQVVEIDPGLARQWIAAGHATTVSSGTPLTKFDALDGLRDLSLEEARHRPCVHCATRANFVLRNKPLCTRHFRSEMEG